MPKKENNDQSIYSESSNEFKNKVNSVQKRSSDHSYSFTNSPLNSNISRPIKSEQNGDFASHLDKLNSQ